MGILVEQLTAKYAAQTPPIDVAAAIRQETDLDPLDELVFESVEECDAHIYELLSSREQEALLMLNQGFYPFPLPEAMWPLALRNRSREQQELYVGSILSVAADGVEKWVMGDLFKRASNRNPRFLADALFYLGDKTIGKMGDAELTVLKAAKSMMALGQEPQTGLPPSNVMETVIVSTGTARPCDEYRGCDDGPPPFIDYRGGFRR